MPVTNEELDTVAVIPAKKVIGVGGAVAFAAYLSMDFIAQPETFPIFMEWLKKYDHPGVVSWVNDYVSNRRVAEARSELAEHSERLKTACDLLAETLR